MRWKDIISENDFRELLKSQHADNFTEVPEHLFHATPADRLPGILEHGLQPRNENLQDHYEPRIYLTTNENSAVKIAFQLRKAIIYRGGQKRNWLPDYVILRVDTDKINSKFKVDGYYPGGVYTSDYIPPDVITVIGKLPGSILQATNWSKFWNWYFWNGEQGRHDADGWRTSDNHLPYK